MEKKLRTALEPQVADLFKENALVIRKQKQSLVFVFSQKQFFVIMISKLRNLYNLAGSEAVVWCFHMGHSVQLCSTGHKFGVTSIPCHFHCTHASFPKAIFLIYPFNLPLPFLSI